MHRPGSRSHPGPAFGSRPRARSPTTPRTRTERRGGGRKSRKLASSDCSNTSPSRSSDTVPTAPDGFWKTTSVTDSCSPEPIVCESVSELPPAGATLSRRSDGTPRGSSSASAAAASSAAIWSFSAARSSSIASAAASSRGVFDPRSQQREPDECADDERGGGTGGRGSDPAGDSWSLLVRSGELTGRSVGTGERNDERVLLCRAVPVGRRGCHSQGHLGGGTGSDDERRLHVERDLLVERVGREIDGDGDVAGIDDPDRVPPRRRSPRPQRRQLDGVLAVGDDLGGDRGRGAAALGGEFDGGLALAGGSMGADRDAHGDVEDLVRLDCRGIDVERDELGEVARRLEMHDLRRFFVVVQPQRQGGRAPRERVGSTPV